MTEGKSHRYIYVVEWDDSVVKPPVIVTHRITLLPEVRVDDFEQFMVTEAFKRLGEVRTRSGRVARQQLLKDVTGEAPERFSDLDVNIDNFGLRTSYSNFVEIGHWERSGSDKA